MSDGTQTPDPFAVTRKLPPGSTLIYVRWINEVYRVLLHQAKSRSSRFHGRNSHKVFPP